MKVTENPRQVCMCIVVAVKSRVLNSYEIEEEEFQVAVMAAVYKDKIVLCKHKEYKRPDCSSLKLQQSGRVISQDSF